MSSDLSNRAKQDYDRIQQALSGDQKAYAELLKRHWDSVYYMLLKMVHNKDDAEDLTIEAFGKAFKNLKSYEPEYAFSTWLFRIANNNAIDHIRRQRNKTISIDSQGRNSDDDNPVQLQSDFADPEEEMIRKQKSDLLLAVVDQLKPRYSELIKLRYFSQYSYEEIAAKLNLPMGTLKAQLFRAKELLYNIIKTKEV
ncbi:MAG: sigma-70 family RNA polymerase sigma factor [Bacteroidales bacterium]|jgi:RNA polymerase sigma-70 factor (ECF subfamily)|nr:sigma-70 family RNA polymerase sigma factor [Bacteroidales bacterium]MDD2571134.1 sigma-70 family RNA polymerase sigma factor [Bacteroidales bacterium]MDD2813863.1 sigma-70 family RNA polymerase sigma factor [Bacteroidales bacterium]MDD3384533.1 sigma-70 family RNA polymerase sigma factor [Bacteroidales bacterium]MDD3812683.1 sigma-70 family RNA polymerase sigma factor [Bacteroidales bacterium]